MLSTLLVKIVFSSNVLSFFMGDFLPIHPFPSKLGGSMYNGAAVFQLRVWETLMFVESSFPVSTLGNLGCSTQPFRMPLAPQHRGHVSSH